MRHHGKGNLETPRPPKKISEVLFHTHRYGLRDALCSSECDAKKQNNSANTIVEPKERRGGVYVNSARGKFSPSCISRLKSMSKPAYFSYLKIARSKCDETVRRKRSTRSERSPRRRKQCARSQIRLANHCWKFAAMSSRVQRSFVYFLGTIRFWF